LINENKGEHMIKETFYVKSADGQDLYVRRYIGDKNGRDKAIQILHGMAEYGERYEAFADFLVGKGYIVYVHDHRKHGDSISKGQKVGKFTKNDIWAKILADVETVQKVIMDRDNPKELYMIGHSMGSFILRAFLMDYGERVKKAVMIGTGTMAPIKSKVGILTAKVIGWFVPNKPNLFLNVMSVGGYNKAFAPNKTLVDWISRDSDVVTRYIEDPLCGYAYTPKFYEELAKGLLQITKDEEIMKTPDIPLMFLSGEKDPVGEQGQGVLAVVERYRKLGFQTKVDLVNGDRHEILNEPDKEDNYKRILNFIS